MGIYEYAEDIVQEAYIKVLSYDKTINEAYFFFTLRSLAMELHKKNKNIIKVEVEENTKTTLEDIDFKSIKNIYNFINTFKWYDRMLFLLYIDNDYSIRDIAAKTGIGFMSIYNTIKNCKIKIRKWVEKENIQV